MNLTFCSNKLKKVCDSEKQMRTTLGISMSEKLKQRLFELKSADSLEDMRKIPAANCHELGHNRQGQLAVDLHQPKRLIFKPDHNPTPTKPDGGLDWTKVTSIEVVEIVDYH
ncbi:MAG: killer suppression protein [Nitrospira sp.]|nr:killer suppression protein [Nitrospira sp.]